MERVGIRELRQNLSVYVKRVLEGDTFEVTEHGNPVAVLGPLPDDASALARLVRSGRMRPATGALKDLGPPRGRSTDTASEALQQQREDRI